MFFKDLFTCFQTFFVQFVLVVSLRRQFWDFGGTGDYEDLTEEGLFFGGKCLLDLFWWHRHSLPSIALLLLKSQSEMMRESEQFCDSPFFFRFSFSDFGRRRG